MNTDLNARVSPAAQSPLRSRLPASRPPADPVFDRSLVARVGITAYARCRDHAPPPVPKQPELYDYLPTAKGRDVAPAFIALTDWGDRWAAPDRPPIFCGHTVCGSAIGHEAVREVRPGGRPL